MRKSLIVGNWKMCNTPSQGEKMLGALLPMLQENHEVQAVICPPATGICVLSKTLAATNTTLALGAQNLHYLQEGAYTGEISGPMLVDLGVKYVIVGHSERREYFGETNQIVAKKAEAAVANGLIPIICVGESQEQKQAGQTLAWIKQQVAESLSFWDGKKEIVVAYEPIWAIGTGLTATSADAEEVIAFIRSEIEAKWGSVAQNVQLLYGGSVKPETMSQLMNGANIDGVLVGGASLQADSFGKIINYKN